jgi:hypothetical protein
MTAILTRLSIELYRCFEVVAISRHSMLTVFLFLMTLHFLSSRADLSSLCLSSFDALGKHVS